MHLAIFRSSKSLSKVSAWPLVLVLGLGACGYKGSADQSRLHEEESSALSFTSWCENWALLCETEPSTNPNPTNLESEDLAAISTIANEALNNPITFSVTRAEIDSAELSQAAASLGFTTELNKVKSSLDSHQWQSIGLEGKSLVSHSVEGGTVSAASGLGFTSGPALALSLGDKASVAISGLSLSSEAAAQSSVLSSLTVGEGESVNLGLASGQVQNVPLKFVGDSLASAFGFESEVSAPAPELTAAQIIGAAYPILSWANKPQRTVSLNRQFFAVAGTQLSPVIAGESFGPAIINALSALNTFAISATAGKNVAHATQVSGAKLECNVNNGTAKVTLDKEFGLKRYYQVDGGVGLEFFGVKASAKLALGIPLTLKRVELRADKITILDIPIIGKVDVPLSSITGSEGSGSSSETTIDCNK